MKINYAILTTPRTGSTLLCEYIASTKLLGMPDTDQAKLFLGAGKNLEGKYPKIWRQYIEYNRTPNGIAGTAFMFEYFDIQLRQHLKPREANHLMNQFNDFVWLRRSDVILQAISWHIAIRSGKWHSTGQSKASGVVEYDFDEIAWKVAFIEGMNARYRSWLGWRGIKPLEIWYNQIVSEPEETIRRMGAHLGVKLPLKLTLKHSVEKLTDSRKQTYRDRFINESAGRLGVHPLESPGLAHNQPAR